jgi:hypothetical protein
MASKNKALGRASETKFVSIIAGWFNLIIRDKTGDNHRSADIARAEEVSQILDNSGQDIWIEKSHPLSRFIFQVKRKLLPGKKSSSIDIQPLLDDGRLGYIMLFDLKKRTNINQMSHGEAVVMSLDTLKLLLDAYTRDVQSAPSSEPKQDKRNPAQ